MNSFRVGLNLAFVLFELNALIGEIVNRPLNVIHDEIEHGESCRRVVWLHINKETPTTRLLDFEALGLLTNRKSQRLLIEGPGFFNVID